MSKRKRGSDNLTGGSGDYNPQFFVISTTQSGVDTTTTDSELMPPGVGLNATNNKPAIMEILKIFFFFVNIDTGVESSIKAFVSHKNWGASAPTNGHGDSTVIASVQANTFQLTSGDCTVFQPVCVDLTDSVGHGVLYGHQNIYLTVQSASTAIANNVVAKIMYRVKNITQNEVLGLVLQTTSN